MQNLVDMDLSKVYVVRSAKGVDMLCVDDFLYHFDRVGKNNTYRWLCNRRKDKTAPCRSRISTILPNSLDKSTHVVVDVNMGHTHPHCSDHEITKVSHRKRLSNMKPEGYSPSQPKRARVYERATAALTPPEWIKTTDSVLSDSKSSIKLDFEDKDHVYMLRRRDGRVMVCIDGHLYYLNGKSSKSEVYRWICVRKRDIECTAKICTEATLTGSHRIRSIESDAHIHPHYSAAKLMHMFTKHQINLVEDEQTTEVLEECPGLEFFDPESEFLEISRSEDAESIIIEECEENCDVYINAEGTEINEAPAPQEESLNSVFPKGTEVIDNFEPSPGHNPLTETDLTKFSFLPSAKGRKVLCLNKYLFHFDSQSRSTGHMFFTCILRRDKQYKCHVRVTMDPNSEHGPLIMRINGEHTHKPDLQEIIKRINRQKKLENTRNGAANTTDPRSLRSGKVKEQHSSNEEDNEDEYMHADPNDPPYDPDSSYEEFEDDLQGDGHSETLGKVVMKKVIGLDGIQLEPQSCEKPSMIVQYLKDGADNISAKIEILPNALENVKAPAYKPPQPKITNNKPKGRKSLSQTATRNETHVSDMDLTKICTLRSAKGSEMLCVDGYIYHAKNRGLISRNYWVCIKSRDPEINCKSRISTATQKDGTIRVLRVYNSHSHPINENDIKRRFFNEINKKSNKKLTFRPLHFISKSLDEIKHEYGDLAIERLNVSNISSDIVVHKKPRTSGGSSQNSSYFTMTQDESKNESSLNSDLNDIDYEDVVVEDPDEEYERDNDEEDQYITYDVSDVPEMLENPDSIIEVVEEVAESDIENYGSLIDKVTMKLYAVSDGPPSLAVRMTLNALDIQYELYNVDFCAMEHHTKEYAKMNPQKEIPVLEDNGFYLSESIAIMQYLCDKYAPESSLYPQDPNQRALVNQRLCFNMSFFYAPISAHAMAPIFFDYERTPMSLKKVENALEVFETYLQRLGTKYAAGEDITIADFALVSSTLCLEAIGFNLTKYSLVQKWYDNFKMEYPELWTIANSGMQEIKGFEQNPPDLSHIQHPFHPIRKFKA